MTALATISPQKTYERVMKSNLQPEEKSQVRQWAEQMLGPLEAIGNIRAEDAPGGFLSVARQSSEGLMMAGLAAYAHVNVKNGLDVRGIPVDGAGGLGLAIASAFMGHSQLGTDARNFGVNGMTICAFRKFVDIFARARLARGRDLYPHLMPGYTSGQAANDPVAAAAADL